MKLSRTKEELEFVSGGKRINRAILLAMFKVTKPLSVSDIRALLPHLTRQQISNSVENVILKGKAKMALDSRITNGKMEKTYLLLSINTNYVENTIIYKHKHTLEDGTIIKGINNTAEHYGVKPSTIKNNLRKGMTFDEAIHAAVEKKRTGSRVPEKKINAEFVEKAAVPKPKINFLKLGI